ncbi:HlyD family secretion protein [Methylobacterium nodulans]|uniref:Secretion protein HlyD family protein n=1 Tax=Methylobacterium nodulans (strain LMG 21967 / CNCM I-2342 / ORS 2060) TaxID=460265 RepID=B8IXA2_METNO|nr:HlyD family efflux transporter periplasmic adaptor subunit [Methylobacterium nodulans]ACL63143.1 secretion protein HlyD family protein [Methylobacterium nodulans ORS 2060]
MSQDGSDSELAAGQKQLPIHRESLFRAEVLAEGQAQWLGTVLLEPRLTHWMFALFASAAVMAIVLLLVFGSYTRKARINGWLVPEQGVVRSFSPQAGVITEVLVQEGMAVRKGSPVLVISTEMLSSAAGATRQEVVRQLKRRRDSMMQEKSVQVRVFENQINDARKKLDILSAERKHLEVEVGLQKTKIEMADRTAVRLRELRKRDIVTAPRLEEAEKERLDEAAKLQALERSLATLEREQAEAWATLQAVPLRRQIQENESERSVAALEQDLIEAEARREIVITAPQDGTITGLQAEPGGNATTSIPLFGIVPSRSKLQAQLFSPSRGIGFLRAGQRVLLRYQAFPYQKFGFYGGVVTTVSRSALSPAELNQTLAGLTALFGSNEPIYRVTVELDRQTAVAYGQAVALQPGMQLEADVLIESRRLIEWVLEPLYTLSGSWHA